LQRGKIGVFQISKSNKVQKKFWTEIFFFFFKIRENYFSALLQILFTLITLSFQLYLKMALSQGKKAISCGYLKLMERMKSLNLLKSVK